MQIEAELPYVKGRPGVGFESCRGMGLGQDRPLRHDEPSFLQAAFGFDLFLFEFGKDLVPEWVAAFALQLELSVSGDQNEPLVLALSAGVKEFLYNSSAKFHIRSSV